MKLALQILCHPLCRSCALGPSAPSCTSPGALNSSAPQLGTTLTCANSRGLPDPWDHRFEAGRNGIT